MELNMWLYKDGLPRHDISLIVDSSQNTDNYSTYVLVWAWMHISKYIFSVAVSPHSAS